MRWWGFGNLGMHRCLEAAVFCTGTMGFKVWGLGFGFRVQGLGLRVQGLGLGV